MDNMLAELITAFAPTVSNKLINIISRRKMKRDEMNIVLIALLAEQNYNTAKSLNEMSKQLVKLSVGMNEVLREIKTVNEGIAVLLKRTES